MASKLTITPTRTTRHMFETVVEAIGREKEKERGSWKII
jgi:hypothetical protein